MSLLSPNIFKLAGSHFSLEKNIWKELGLKPGPLFPLVTALNSTQ